MNNVQWVSMRHTEFLLNQALSDGDADSDSYGDGDDNCTVAATAARVATNRTQQSTIHSPCTIWNRHAVYQQINIDWSCLLSNAIHHLCITLEFMLFHFEIWQTMHVCVKIVSLFQCQVWIMVSMHMLSFNSIVQNWIVKNVSNSQNLGDVMKLGDFSTMTKSAKMTPKCNEITLQQFECKSSNQIEI